MAADIQSKFGINVELIKGRDGVFEVNIDNRTIFSKKSIGRFPEPNEVEDALAAEIDAS